MNQKLTKLIASFAILTGSIGLISCSGMDKENEYITEIENLKEKIEELTNQNNALIEEKNALEKNHIDELKTLNSQIADLNKSLDALKKERDELKVNSEADKAKIKTLEEEIKSKENEIATLNKTIETLNADFEKQKASYDERIHVLTEKILEVEQSNNKLQNEINDLKNKDQIIGRFIAPTSIIDETSTNLVLDINDDYYFTFVKNDDYEHAISGSLIRNDYNLKSEDNNFTVVPIYNKEKQLTMLVTKYYDEVNLKTDYAAFGKGNFVTFDDHVSYPYGNLFSVRTNNSSEKHWIKYNEETIEEVEVKNYNAAFDTKTIYEIVERGESRFFKSNGISLYENSSERGEYNVLGYENKKTLIFVDGFDGYTLKIDNQNIEGTYHLDTLNNAFHLKINNQDKLFRILDTKTDNIHFDLQNEELKDNILTNFSYWFTIKNYKENVQTDVRMDFGKAEFVTGKIGSMNLEGDDLYGIITDYKLDATHLTVKLGTGRLVKFKFDYTTRTITHEEGYFLKETDADGLSMLPTFYTGTFKMNYYDSTEITIKEGRVNYLDNGQTYYSSTKFYERNGEILLLIGFKLPDGTVYGDWVRLDFENMTGEVVESCEGTK